MFFLRLMARRTLGSMEGLPWSRNETVQPARQPTVRHGEVATGVIMAFHGRQMNPFVRRLVTGAALCAAVTLTAADPEPRPLPDPGFGLDKMDRSVDPRVDYVKFAAGGWYAKNEIPADKSRWGAFEELREQNWIKQKAIVEESAANPGAPGGIRQKVGDFFASATNVEAINALGLKPIEADLAAIAAAKSLEDLMAVAVRMHLGVGSPFCSFAFYADQKQSDIYGIYLNQGGLSLPSKEYYFSEKFARERWEFTGHVARMLELAGTARATAYKDAETVFALEKAMAENAKLPVELRDRMANYNKLAIAEGAAVYPGFPLRQLVDGLGLPAGVADIIVGQPKFIEGVGKLLQDRPLDEWKVYLRWQLISASAAYLSEPFDQESFRFKGTVLNGTPAQEPRWQRATRQVDASIGEALGQLYVEKHFPPAAKARMMEMIGNIQAVFRDRLATLDWMSEETRQKALAKFDRFEPMIGYPDKWLDYSAVDVQRGDYFGNVHRAARAESRRRVARTGQKVDRREWGMTPQTVNAYYSPVTNQIVFPAGILQPPFFDFTLDDAVNYGAIGGVIGHEITHGFDDQGRRSDADGNLTDWWATEDANRFRERAQKVVEQFNSFQALPGLAINGQLSLGENIGDLGGTSIAYEALQRSLLGKERKLIDGFTPEQRFYISWTQMWRTKFRDDALRLQVARGPHAPGNFRAFGPLLNQATFFEAFGIKDGDPMWVPPEKRAKVW
jgi:putative endopeptidase